VAENNGVIRSWAESPLPEGVATALERLARSDDVRRIAVMPDVHLASDVCVGTVVATSRSLYPAAVGGDIGCGVAAVAFDGAATALDDERAAAAVLAGLYRAIPLVRHARKRAPELPADLAVQALSAPRLEALKCSEGSLQLGTLGRGNHFVELQADETGRLWLMLHSGSRAMGQAIRDHHLACCRPARSGLGLLDAESREGADYLRDMEWAIRYAHASRRVMARAASEVVASALGLETLPESLVSCNHNHVRRETHDGETLWVHRKGAIAAGLGEPGLIPGSMGTASYHVEGRGVAAALASSAHGAGRRLSRTDARHAVSARDVARQMKGVWFDHRIASGLREEAPSAYKDIASVLRAEAELVRIVRRLRPVLSFKGM
jgi:tRNA-splicing ligase RtcB (3'-phosphate/5'-hydroxy nucleic acid ligase)